MLLLGLRSDRYLSKRNIQDLFPLLMQREMKKWIQKDTV